MGCLTVFPFWPARGPRVRSDAHTLLFRLSTGTALIRTSQAVRNARRDIAGHRARASHTTFRAPYAVRTAAALKDGPS